MHITKKGGKYPLFLFLHDGETTYQDLWRLHSTLPVITVTVKEYSDFQGESVDARIKRGATNEESGTVQLQTLQQTDG